MSGTTGMYTKHNKKEPYIMYVVNALCKDDDTTIYVYVFFFHFCCVRFTQPHAHRKGTKPRVARI